MPEQLELGDDNLEDQDDGGSQEPNTREKQEPNTRRSGSARETQEPNTR